MTWKVYPSDEEGDDIRFVYTTDLQPTVIHEHKYKVLAQTQENARLTAWLHLGLDLMQKGVPQPFLRKRDWE